MEEDLIYTITLADQTKLEKVKKNGDNFIFNGELDTSILTDENLSPTIIEDNQGNVEDHPYMTYVKPYTEDEENTWFVLADIPEEVIRNRQMEAAIAVMANAVLDDQIAEQAPVLFPEWSGDGVAYTVGDRVRYNERLAKCIQSHVSQLDWSPQAAPSLWSFLSNGAEGDTNAPGGDEWPEWTQPTGAHDAYHKGAQVTYEGKHYVSTIDNNVWAPGVAGWTEQN